MSLELSRGGPSSGPTLNPEQQLQLEQQRSIEREERQAQQLPQVQEALDKKINEHPGLQNHLQRYQPDVQDDIKQALAHGITQQLGPNGLRRIDQIRPSNDGGIIVRFNEFDLVKLEPEQIRQSANGHNLTQSLQRPDTPERQQAREQHRERQQQQTLEREQQQARHLPQVTQALDKKINDTPALQNHLQGYPPDAQQEIKQALAKSITQELGPNGLQCIDQIRPTNDGGMIVLFNEFDLVKLDAAQLPKPAHHTGQALAAQPTTPRIEQPEPERAEHTTPPQMTEPTVQPVRQHAPEPTLQAAPTRQAPPERAHPDIPAVPALPDTPLRDPQQRLADIQQQIEPLLGNQLKGYTPEQQKQLVQALTQEVGDFARDTPNIQRIQTGEDGRLTVHYDKYQHVTLDPQEILQPAPPTQAPQRDSAALDAFGQLRQQTEQQLSQYIDSAHYNALEQNVLTNRLTEAIREHGGEDAQIKQISERQDGRLLIELDAEHKPLLLSPQALLAEQGLAEKPEREQPGLQIYRPGLDGPLDDQVRHREDLSKIGHRLFPDDPKLASAASELAWYSLLEGNQHVPAALRARHVGGEVNRHFIHEDREFTVDMSQLSQKKINELAHNFDKRQSGEHLRDIEIHQEKEAARQREQAERQAQYDLFDTIQR